MKLKIQNVLPVNIYLFVWVYVHAIMELRQIVNSIEFEDGSWCCLTWNGQ